MVAALVRRTAAICDELTVRLSLTKRMVGDIVPLAGNFESTLALFVRNWRYLPTSIWVVNTVLLSRWSVNVLVVVKNGKFVASAAGILVDVSVRGDGSAPGRAYMLIGA